MAKQLSSRVQGLKFMQRGAARTSSPPSAAACEEDRSVCQETADPAQEQWVLPTQFRACTNTTALPKNDWNAWLFDAYEEKPKALNRRRTFGNVASADSVRKSADVSDSEAGTSNNEASASDSDDDAPPTFRKPPSAQGAKRRVQSSETSQRKRVAQPHRTNRRKG